MGAVVWRDVIGRVRWYSSAQKTCKQELMFEVDFCSAAKVG